MAEILGPALNLRLYESHHGFDTSSLIVDLGFFIREHGPSLVGSLLPQIPRELLTRLQYAPDAFSYHLLGESLVAAEDLKRGRLVDVRTRIDRQESRRGAGVYHVMGRISETLADDRNVSDGQMLAWISPKEGFSRHGYLNVGRVIRDNEGRRTLAGYHYMSNFDQSTLLQIVSNLDGEEIPPDTDPRLISRMLFSVGSIDAVAVCERLPTAKSIDNMPIRLLWGSDSRSIWRIIRQVISGGERQISRVISQARERVDKMQVSMAVAVLGMIETVLETINNEAGPVKVDLGKGFSRRIDEQNLLAAFASAVAGCVGFLGFNSPVSSVVTPAAFVGEKDLVHCPNCNQTVHCAVGDRCPGCRHIRPC